MISYYRCKYQRWVFKTLECILFYCKDRLTTLPLYNINQTLNRGRDRMVAGATITCAISAYHHWCYGFESRSGRCV